MNIKKVVTQEEWKKVQKLMFAVNHEELGKAFLQEEVEFNENVCTLFVEWEGEPVGCVRCFFERPKICELAKRGINLDNEHTKVALTDRLLILPKFRKSKAVLYLVNEIYRQALLQSTHIALMECEDHLLKFYRRMGFIPYRYVNYDYGGRYQLYINPWDISHLERVRSPFVSVYQQFMREVAVFIGEKRIAQYA
ncbi:hypothetical protein SAMN06298216_0162 [Spirosomataceae bacterium TFI 002]|nr:hypothetical protein SAMN06298216_0162 [Spirosomataceae bacterium TFI 002]